MEGADFSGYATKANVKCTDGRVILPDAFKHQDQMRVPLVWQHISDAPTNIIGHAILENRNDGVYAYGFFNGTDQGKTAKELVKHSDITAMSIYANRLIEKAKTVSHGVIREVSLVLAGANPGALIDYVNIAHADGDVVTLEDEAIIYSGLELEHSEDDESNDSVEHTTKEKEPMATTAKNNEKTVKEIFESMTEEQKNVVYYLIGTALSNDDAEHSDDDIDFIRHTLDGMTDEQRDTAFFLIGEADHQKQEAQHSDDSEEELAHSGETNEEGNSMKHNVFEQNGATNEPVLSHADAASIFDAAKRLGSMKDAVEDYALKHGIENIDILFPDAKSIMATPDFDKRRTEWVADVMNGTTHTPFSRIKSTTAHLTLPEARAKGYIKGNMKKEEFFKVSKRSTTPQSIYKKQKLDRDDILDITDFDVVMWLKGEMRLMLEEEIARAILIGDGRSAGDDDKISEDHVRPIASDDDLYVTYIYINLGDTDSSAEEIVDALTLQRRHYRGSGNPVFYTSETVLAQMLLVKDGMGRRIYPTVNDLAAALRVSKIVAVEIMDEPSIDVVGIMVNLRDYTIGADRGGEVSMFDDFDIDYNQYKYLIETRMSGALIKPKAALVLKKVADASVLATPVAPTWNNTNKTVTVATTTGITYKNKLTNTTLTSGSPVTLAEGDELEVIAIPTSGYYLASSANDEFLFTYEGGLVQTS